MTPPRPDGALRPRSAGRLAPDLRTAADHSHGLACDILAAAPLVRALARVRTVSRGAAAALTSATLQRALTGVADAAAVSRPADGDLRPWLLGLQRRLFATGHLAARQPVDGRGSFAIDPPARGATAAWQVLHDALLQLPDDLREPLFLAEGADCDTVALARILGCGTAETGRRVRAGRAALLAALAPLPAERPLPGARRAHGRPGGRPWRSSSPSPDEAAGDRQRFPRHLTIALYRALLESCPDAGERRALGRLLERETAASPRVARPGRSSWLRLLFVTYACPEQGQPSHAVAVGSR